MSQITNEDAIKDKLDYIGLDLNNIPEFLLKNKNIDYRPTKNFEENTYKVYKYIPISKIYILLTPTNRLNTIEEKYTNARPIKEYLDSKNEENVLKYTTFLRMLETVTINQINSIEVEQNELKDKIPFKIKYTNNYLWQIYYSDISDTYFMLVPTEDEEYETFFYLLKKQLELKNSGKEEFIFVPITHEEYSDDYLKKSQIADIEKYIWQFTKNWPNIYEVEDINKNKTIQIVGNISVYDGLESIYKVVLNTQKEAEEFYRLLKALFILETELPHYYHFDAKIDENGGLQFFYKETKMQYDDLFYSLNSRYKETVLEIEKTQKEKKQIKQEVEELHKKVYKKEQEYIDKEKKIATYLECRKTFFGRVKYFFKSKKKNKEKIKVSDAKENTKQSDNEENIEEIKYIKKENYTIEDIISIFKQLDSQKLEVKNLTMDKKALEIKDQSLQQKIKNAKLYIEEIDKHEKSIFEFWKFANKDELQMLTESKENVINTKHEKVYDYKEDIEEIELQIDKKQRNMLVKEEQDAIYLASTNVLQALNNIDDENILESNLQALKEELQNERIIFNKSEADLFGDTIEDHTKVKILGNKKHRETLRNKLNLLDISMHTTINDYQERLINILSIIIDCMEKVTSPVSIPVYLASKYDISKKGIQIFDINIENSLNEQEDENEINLYRINVKENEKKIIYLSNSIYYNNYNKTLPLGMNVSTKCLLDMTKVKLNLLKKSEIRIVKMQDEFTIKTKKIHIYEFERIMEENNDK